jgi:hypothetical protein
MWDATVRLRDAIDRRCGGERGQGTVEYVGLVVAVALLLVAVSTTLKGGNGIDDKVASLLASAIERFAKL